MRTVIYGLIPFFLLPSCETGPSVQLPENYHDDLNTWKADRDERLRSPTGFVNLAGLFWLEEGVSTIGSDSSNTIVFPEAAPDRIGSLTLADGSVSFIPEPGVDVLVDSAEVSEAMVFDTSANVASEMQSGRFRWFIIERAGNFGIRLRDLEEPKTKEPLAIEYFPWSEDHYVTATYQLYDEPITRMVKNIVGFEFEEEFAGEYVFEINGRACSLLPSMGEEISFVMFGDASNGEATYGGGRYLVADLPDESGKVVLDFNKAYNPPCAFSDFATCPLPIADNILEVEVKAGERAYHH